MSFCFGRSVSRRRLHTTEPHAETPLTSRSLVNTACAKYRTFAHRGNARQSHSILRFAAPARRGRRESASAGQRDSDTTHARVHFCHVPDWRGTGSESRNPTIQAGFPVRLLAPRFPDIQAARGAWAGGGFRLKTTFARAMGSRSGRWPARRSTRWPPRSGGSTAPGRWRGPCLAARP